MKKGYIVWNNSNYGPEFFGIYKNVKTAEWKLRKVIRTRFGHCPRDLDKLMDDPYAAGGDDSYGISSFEENDGEDY